MRLRKSSFDHLINLSISISRMSSNSPYNVVSVKDDPEAYRYLTEAYFKWVYEPKCDTNYNKVVQVRNEQRDVTFMRDDSIGDPKDPDDQKPNIQEITAPVGTDIFFPVYYFHSSVGEGDGKGGTCESTERCIEVADDDLSKIDIVDGKPDIWAKIKINGKNEVPITSDFKDHFVTVSQFTIKVGDNRLNREPEYHLKPGTYDGVVRGTFMYLRNFKKGEYVLYFGGRASNFKTISEYTMQVK
jgi:hypothetical protein